MGRPLYDPVDESPVRGGRVNLETTLEARYLLERARSLHDRATAGKGLTRTPANWFDVAPMMKLVLIRHGESTWNVENKFTGWTDVDLSPKGTEEAHAAGRLLK